MRVSRTLITLLALAACTPPPPVPDAGECTLLEAWLAQPVSLVPEGEQDLVLVPSKEGVASAKVSATLSGTAFESRPFDRAARWRVDLVPGDAHLEAEVECGGHVVRSLGWTLHVYPRVDLSESFARECLRLPPAPGGRFDCDGVVIDSTGTPTPGFVSGSTSRVFMTPDGGWGRWVRSNGGLLRELDGQASNTVAFPDTEVLVVTDRFAFTDGQLVTFEDGGLRSRGYDAGPQLDGEDFAPCAASANAIAWCSSPFAIFDPPRADVPWVVCQIDGACSSGTGLFVRQDLRSGRVTFRDDARFFQLDLSNPQILAQRPTRPDEVTNGPSAFQRGDGEQRRMHRVDSSAFGFLAPDPSLETFTVVPWLPTANTEFVWVVDGGVTSFARLH